MPASCKPVKLFWQVCKKLAKNKCGNEAAITRIHCSN